MDLTKASLPSAVEVGGRFFEVHTGHPYWFRFHEVYSQPAKYAADFRFLYAADVPSDEQSGVAALLDFFHAPHELPRAADESGERVLDYTIDADYIYAAILQCYGVDLFEREWHWHKVRAMIAGLKDTKLNDIIYYRCSTPGKNQELAKAKAAWALPQRTDPEDEAAREAFSAQFYGAQF